VLAGLERAPRQLEVRVARRADVDRVDVVATEELARIGDGVRNIEFLCSRARAIDFGIGDGDDAAAGFAAVSREVRAACPGRAPYGSCGQTTP